MLDRIRTRLRNLIAAVKRCARSGPKYQEENGTGTPTDTRVSRPNLATEKLIYDHVKDAAHQQREVANWQDDKMLRIFGSASIVIGFLGLSSNNLTHGSGLGAIFLLLPLLPYVFTAIVAFRHLNPRFFRVALRADELRSYRDKSEEQVRRGLIEDIGEAYSENRRLLEEKASYIRYAIVATAIEVGLVVLAIILYRLI